MPDDTDRQRQIGQFFSTHADQLARIVINRSRGVAPETIEDACQTAWTILVRRPDVTLDARGFGWLVAIATHEAWAAARQRGAEIPFAGFAQSAAPEEGELTEPPAPTRDVPDQIADRIEHQQRLADLATLKPQDRTALWLRGLGYSYKEIAVLTDASYTAVNRRVTEGRQTLRDRHADRNPSQGGEEHDA